jgi:DNA-binding response OmpR family regulator
MNLFGQLRKAVGYAVSPVREVDRVQPRICLIVGGRGEDYAFFPQILGRLNWECLHIGSTRKAAEFLLRHRVPVVVMEEELAVGGWQTILKSSRHLKHPPKLVIASLLSDSLSWDRVLQLGASGVLLKPFDQREVIRAVTMARLAWLEEKQRAGLPPEAPASQTA